MVAEFNWWLLIVGVVAGGVLTWLVLADTTRREREIGDEELLAEAAWITKAVAGRVDADAAEDVLRAHRRYLGFPPPDVLVAPDDLPALEGEGLDARAAGGPRRVSARRFGARSRTTRPRIAPADPSAIPPTHASREWYERGGRLIRPLHSPDA